MLGNVSATDPETVAAHRLLVICVEQRRPKIMPGFLPVHFFRTILEPIRKSHVAVSKINGVLPPGFGCYRVLLGQYQAHDFGQTDILEEKLDMNWIRWILCRLVYLILDKVVLSNHLNVGVIRVDMDWTTERHGY